MPINIFQNMKPSPDHRRNAFDLSRRDLFSCRVGELLPIFCLETIPRDYIKVRFSDLMRAMPMVTSPFLRLKQHVDYYYVPYTYMWTNFNEFITKRSEPTSAAMNMSLYCPCVSGTAFNEVVSYSGTSKDLIGSDLSRGARTLLDLLGYGSSFYNSGNGPLPPPGDTLNWKSNEYFNIWRVAAYNMIWYHYYRQRYYDDGTLNMDSATPSDLYGNVAKLFNFDDLACDSLEGSLVSSDRLLPMLQMRYRTWKRDLFTGLLPAQQYGDVSRVSVALSLSGGSGSTPATSGFVRLTENGSLYSSTSVQRYTASTSGASPEYASRVSSTIAPTAVSVDNQFDILALRKAEAVQLWRERALRAGNRVSDNMAAHYGTKPDYAEGRVPRFLGSVSSSLNIGDIDATAQTGDTGNSMLGSIAGKGIASVDENGFTFQADDFGVIMGIFSLLPEQEYNARGVDKCNMLLSSDDYFVPEYENLGLAPVTKRNFSYIANDDVLGYAPQYWYYKQAFDKCHGQFMNDALIAGELRSWATPKYDISPLGLVPSSASYLKSLYVDYHLLDTVFNYTGTIGQSSDDDYQFIVDAYHNVDCVRAMSVMGLPE